MAVMTKTGSNSSSAGVDVGSVQSRRTFLWRSASAAAVASLGGGVGTAFAQASPGTLAGAGLIGAFPAVSTKIGPSEWAAAEWTPGEPFLCWGKTLRVQPILMYATPQPRKERSWRSWGDVLTEEAATEEMGRISEELGGMCARAEFPLEVLPPVKVKTQEEAAQAIKSEHDVRLVYAAAGRGDLLETCVDKEGDTILFMRHRSGSTYYWYEGISVRYLRTDTPDNPGGGEAKRLGNTHVDDVVVDDPDDVLWRLRALYAVKNTVGSRVVAVGGVMGKYAGDAPQIAREKYKLDLVEISYDEMEKRIKSALNDTARMARAEEWTAKYLALPGTTLKTERPFVVNAFMLYEIFKDLMKENGTAAFTIKDCMATIMPMSKTTACLTLGVMNDEGLVAFCESDFVIVPAGILMRHITGKPIFMHNSTFPHKGVVTCAHCSAPRRMDAVRYEPTEIHTHEESDFGAAPKVDIPVGQEVSFISPEYTKGRWVGIRGNVEDNPFLPICRSQQDVRIQGQWKKLLREARDSHWMMAYGDHLREIGYAARKLGLRWDNVSDV